MVDYKNLPDTSTPLNKTNLNKMQTDLQTNIITGQEFATNKYIDGKKVYGKRFAGTYESTSQCEQDGVLEEWW